MKKKDLHSSSICAVFGLYIAFEGYRLGPGSFQAPKSGFLILVAGVVLACLSTAVFVQALFSRQEEREALWKGLQWSKGVRLLAASFAYALVLTRMGFLLSTFLFLLYLFKGLEPQRWHVAIVLSLITIVSSHLIFVLLLECQFPEGILEQVVEQAIKLARAAL